MSITNYPDADFTPDIPNSGANTGKQSYNPTGSFRFWAQKVLPTVYDDSLSYYEILTKVVNYLNAVIQNVDSLNESVDNTNSAFDDLQAYVNTSKYSLIMAYNKLQSYVNTYFDSLDVQEEINAKLDGMASDGSLSTVVSPFIPSAVTDWLSKNIKPTSPAVDASLSISRAAADAKVTGEFVRTNSAELNALNDCNIDGLRRIKAWANGSWSGTNLTDINTRIRPSNFIFANVGDIVTIKNGSYVHAVAIWKGTLKSSTVIRNDNSFSNSDEKIIMEDDGFFIVSFADKSDKTRILSPDDFDGSITITSYQMRALTVDRLSPSRKGYGFVQSSDGTLYTGGDLYNYSQMIEVSPGDKYEFSAYGSSGILMVAAYNNVTDTVADVSKSVQGPSQTGLKSGVYTVPQDVHYVRLTSSSYFRFCIFRRYIPDVFQSTALPSETDINNLTTGGIYQCLNGAFTADSTPPSNSDVGNLIVCKDTTSGIVYQSFIESYTGHVYSRIKRASGWDNWACNSKKEISILFVGNSLTQDGIAYLPYLLKKYYPEILFHFYMWYNGGKTLGEQYQYFTSNTPCEIFSVAENTYEWTNYNNSKTMTEILSTYKFDIVCMQEYFNYKATYTDADLTDWTNCKDYINSHYTGGNGLEFISLFHAPKRDDATEIFRKTVAGNNLLLRETITDDMIPNGIAVYRALSTALDNLGDQGHLSADGTHTQEGLPCLLQTYVSALWIFDRIGFSKSVYGCPIRITTDIYNSINVPGANIGSGVITGTEAENLLAQEIAIKAYKEGKYYVMNNQYTP